MAHAHSAAAEHRGRLLAVLVVTASVLVVEAVGGLVSGSLALLADAGHMLTDVAGIGLALLAVFFAQRPADPDRTFGWFRLEILAAAANAVVLLGVSALVLWEAWRRFVDPPEVASGLMLAVAVVGLAANGLSMWLLRDGQVRSLNMRGAYLEVVSDLLGSVAVIVAAVVIAATGIRRADPVASAVIGLFILPRTWRLLREAVDVLLEATPRGIDLEEVRRHIVGTGGVEDVHDLHAWTITSGMNVVSAHVVLGEGADPSLVLDELCACLMDDFDIEHSTFQLETRDRRRIEDASHP
ncbi:MAG TPA: cation diffusion facilitator family transporter [Actinomycetota bacterium]